METIFAKRFILDVWHGCDYAYGGSVLRQSINPWFLEGIFLQKTWVKIVTQEMLKITVLKHLTMIMDISMQWQNIQNPTIFLKKIPSQISFSEFCETTQNINGARKMFHVCSNSTDIRALWRCHHCLLTWRK